MWVCVCECVCVIGSAPSEGGGSSGEESAMFPPVDSRSPLGGGSHDGEGAVSPSFEDRALVRAWIGGTIVF